MIGRVCLFVGWFSRSFVAIVVISLKVKNPIIIKFSVDVQHLGQISLYLRSRSKINVTTINIKNIDLQM